MTTLNRSPQSPDVSLSPGRVWPSRVIFFKEFKEIFRDRRTVMSVVIGPLVLTPALFLLMGLLITRQVDKQRTQVYDVGVIGGSKDSKILQSLQKLPGLRLHTDAGTQEQAESAIKERKLNAAIVLPEDTAARMQTGKAVPIRLLEDAGNDTSQSAAGRIQTDLGTVGEQIVAQRLRAENLPPDYAKPFNITEQPIKSGGSAGTAFLSMMLPYILALSAFGGAIYAAFDQVAGEKERGTLETLLVSPATRRDIVLGKFGAVVAVCLISSVLSVAGLVLAFSLPSKGIHALAAGGMHLSATSLVVILLVMLPLSVLFAGALLAVSTFARNQKEAQTYLAPLMMLVIVPAMSSMFLSADASLTLALVPILGTSIIIKQALSGSYNILFIGLAFAASALYAGLALAFATRLFQRESVLIKA